LILQKRRTFIVLTVSSAIMHLSITAVSMIKKQIIGNVARTFNGGRNIQKDGEVK